MVLYNCSEGLVLWKGGSKMDDLVKKIKQIEKVIAALTQLALSIGTLLAVIKMVIESLI